MGKIGRQYDVDGKPMRCRCHATREFKIPRRRRRQKHRLKSDSSIYETLVRLSQLGHYVLCKQTGAHQI